MNYKIVIPTYKRSDIINNRTLKILKESDIEPSIIYIFVANQEEYDLYTNAIDKNQYNKIIIGKLGLVNQRNFISKYFNQDDKLLFMDDDIKEIIAGYRDAENNEVINMKINSLNKLFINSFNECIEQKCNLFGYYPINKPYFMKPCFTTDLRFIAGSLYGVINKQEIKLNTDEKEDYERTLEYFVRDGRVLRINFIGIKSAYYTEKGGLQETRTEETIENGALYIYNKYPFLTSIKYREKYKKKLTEVVLNNRIDTKVLRFKLPINEKINNLKQMIFKGVMEMKLPRPASGIRGINKNGNVNYRRANIIMTDEDMNNNETNYGSTTFGYGMAIGAGHKAYTINNKYPEIYKLLIEFGKLITPKDKPFSAITCNRNLKCKYHYDGVNSGSSVFITLGDYTGGGIFIEGQEYEDVRDTITIFNGHDLKHKTNSFEGNRIALIYYNSMKTPPEEYTYKGVNEDEPSFTSVLHDTKI